MKSFNINFFSRKSRADSDKLKANRALIFCRISMNSIRKDFSIGREIESSRWLSEKGKTIGKTPLEKEFNAYLATITETFYRIERDMLAEDIEVNCEALIERYNKQEKDDNTPSSLFAAMDLHNKEMLQLKEMGMIARETHSRY